MSKPLRLLVIDQYELDTLRTLAELRRGDFEPTYHRVINGDELSAALAWQEWELAIYEGGLGGVTPFEALEALRDHEVDVPLIYLSEAASAQELVRLMKAGAADCLPKSQIGRLAAAVEQELEASRSRRAARDTERRAHEAEERYRTLIEEIPAVTYIAWADRNGARVYVSPQIEQMTGYAPTEWIADPNYWAERLHEEDRERVLESFLHSCRAGQPFLSEYRIVNRQGEIRWWRDEGRVLRDDLGKPQFMRGLVLDVTAQKEALETIRYMTYYDPLTGLPNWTLFHERLEETLASADEAERSVALLVVAVTGLRDVYSSLGPAMGDQTIQELAGRLAHVMGQPDRVARLRRGDEFALLLPDANEALARGVGAKVLVAFERPVMIDKLPLELEASVGISVRPPQGGSAAQLLREADLAAQGGEEAAGLSVYSPRSDPYDPSQLFLMGELRRAIESDQLVLHYQPVIDLKAGGVVGAEALVRWQHPRRGLLPPDKFVPLAERCGLIKPLTHWVLAEAAAQCRAWGELLGRLSMAVNLSARNLQDQGLVEHVAALLAETRLDPSLLRLELTESAVMADPDRASQTLLGLRGQGVGLAIDDFGTGYSSLAYLSRLPVSQLKIDRSFVMGMRKADIDKTIVRSTNDLGHNLGLSVVAEGVEDQGTFRELEDLGCDAAQGFHIARPMEPGIFVEWLGDSPWEVVGP